MGINKDSTGESTLFVFPGEEEQETPGCRQVVSCLSWIQEIEGSNPSTQKLVGGRLKARHGLVALRTRVRFPSLNQSTGAVANWEGTCLASSSM